MPITGGAADKLGNRYEALWVMDCLLRIVDGESLLLTLEPIDPDESQGIEFTLATEDGITEFWSIKRQTTQAEGWTLRTLVDGDKRGRSVLGDLLAHIERDSSYRGVFASQLGARDFNELRDHAVSKEQLIARLDRADGLKDNFQRYLLPLVCQNSERARYLLQHTRAYAADELHLRESVDFKIRMLIYSDSDSSTDPMLVRGLLSQFALDHIHVSVDRASILAALSSHGFKCRDWAQELTVPRRIDEIYNEYTQHLHTQRINGTFIQLPGIEGILGSDNRPLNPRTLVIGTAGCGKSTTLAEVAERLHTAGTPVIGIRFDNLDEGVFSTKELGRKLLLPDSPAMVLAGIANGGPSVLIIDQLDAVSIASGRRTDLWMLFQSLLNEANRLPNLSLIIGCRAFDLEHDHRMRTMVSADADIPIVEIKPLALDQVDALLRQVMIDPTPLPLSLKNILTLPLHLSMFLQLNFEGHPPVRNLDELFDHYWIQSEQRVSLRLGRRFAWNRVIDALVTWLSDHQQLSAPEHVLQDDFFEETPAMASENILVHSGGRYRFFHESFFDYAFARRFMAKGGRLIDLLVGGEQHLFRRAQVRQVLTYLRAREARRYLAELEALLLSDKVRFHIKSLVFQWLASLLDPLREEWELLQHLNSNYPKLHSHIRRATWGSSAWFDILDETGYLDTSLSGSEEEAQQACISLFGHPIISEQRSKRIAELLTKHRQPGDKWDQYLRHMCHTGSVYHSPEMFNLFLSLVDDGTLDDLRPGFAVNDDWWMVLYSMAEKRPELASIAIGHWFDRTLVRCEEPHFEEGGSISAPNSFGQRFREYLDRSLKGTGTGVIFNAAKSSLAFAEVLLPRIAQVVEITSEYRSDYLHIDPIWSLRSYGDQQHSIHGALLSALAQALESLAISAPAELDRLLTPYVDRPHDTIAYLVLRAWNAATSGYASRLADYLAADPRRLKVGYFSWAGGGYAANHWSVQVTKKVSAYGSIQQIVTLEKTILDLQDTWEGKHPKVRGARQLELLEALGDAALSPNGRAKLHELRRKFPNEGIRPPKSMEMSWVGPPIPESAQSKMSDKHWIKAMRKYAGVDYLTYRELSRGGEHQLAQAIEREAQKNPSRFIRLARRMPDDLPSSYFGAILRGIATCAPTRDRDLSTSASIDEVAALLRRTHSLSAKPCGRWILWVVQKWGDPGWPDDVIEIIKWYALNDPDPDEEVWSKLASGGQPYYGGNIHEAGMNSTRGSAAEAIARILFDKPDRSGTLLETVHHLATDRVVAVRACAIEALAALLNLDEKTAISWFLECVADSRLFGTEPLQRFMRYAGYRDYPAIRPVLMQMLSSEAPTVVESASRHICILGLDNECAALDAERVRSGQATMRRAAADVYAANIANEVVGQTCRSLLKPFFSDPDESVRSEAASAFYHVSKLNVGDQGDLLSTFLSSGPDQAAINPVVRALEDSPIQLPDLVCRLAESCISAFDDDASDIRQTSALIAMDLSKIVIRLYTQTENQDIQRRCLDLIDKMEFSHFYGIDGELNSLDR